MLENFYRDDDDSQMEYEREIQKWVAALAATQNQAKRKKHNENGLYKSDAEGNGETAELLGETMDKISAAIDDICDLWSQNSPEVEFE